MVYNKNVELKEEKMEIEDDTLYEVENSNLIEGTFIFPSNVKYIGKLGFYNCTKLEYLKIPVGVLGIGEYAFRSCRRLKKVEIPSSVKMIRGNSFAIPETHDQENPLKTVVVTPDRKIDEKFLSYFPSNVNIVVKSKFEEKNQEKQK